MSWIYDVVALIALGMIGVGVAFQWGWPVSLVVSGALLLMLSLFAVLGARMMRAKKGR